MRLATWTLDGDGGSPGRRAAQRRQVGRVAADVWVLVGADPSGVPTHHAVVADSSGTVVLTAEQLRPVPLPEVPGAAAAVVHAGGQHLLVVGVDLRGGPPVDRLDAGLTRLRADEPDLPLVLAGSFGQTLHGHVVGSRVGRVQLSALLQRHGLVAHTATAPSARAGCASVDHVCSPPPATGVTTWSSVDAEAELVLGAHLGYAVDR